MPPKEAAGVLIIALLILAITSHAIGTISPGVPGNRGFRSFAGCDSRPTGSGKTALSLTLAERFSGEIVNCDSVAMYREFEIGTAKPSA